MFDMLIFFNPVTVAASCVTVIVWDATPVAEIVIVAVLLAIVGFASASNVIVALFEPLVMLNVSQISLLSTAQSVLELMSNVFSLLASASMFKYVFETFRTFISDNNRFQTPPPKVPMNKSSEEIETVFTFLHCKPSFISVQFVPLLIDTKTPPPKAAAKRLLSLTANELIFRFVIPLFTALQVFALSVEINTPLPLPAKILLPILVKALTLVYIPNSSPVLASSQVFPLSSDNKIPSDVAARMVSPTRMIENIILFEISLFLATQLFPPSLER